MNNNQNSFCSSQNSNYFREVYEVLVLPLQKAVLILILLVTLSQARNLCNGNSTGQPGSCNALPNTSQTTTFSYIVWLPVSEM